ncbi:MAG: T9SS type A sorting domain-containing protein [FCB group bacterium]
MKVILSILIILFSQGFILANDLQTSYPLNNQSGFIENEGQIVDCNEQIRNDIKYYYFQNNCKVFFLNDRISFVFIKIEHHQLPSGDIRTYPDSTSITTYRADLIFDKCNIDAEQTGIEESQFNYNFYLSHCPKGITNVKSFKQIKYSNIYNNIDLIFYIKDNYLKYNFVVRPGGKIEDIKLRPIGFDSIKILDNRSYSAHTPLGSVQEEMPEIYQNIQNKITKIDGKYEFKDGFLCYSTNQFELTSDLIIDPNIYWSTYVGGSADDKILGMSIDYKNNIIVSGVSYSIDFPTSTGSYQTKNAGSADIFITKMSPDGNIIWSTYFGGSADDRMSGGVAITKTNDIWIAGETISSNVPLTINAYQKQFRGGSGDGLIINFDSNGQLLYASYYGGANYDAFTECKINKNNNLCLIGWTFSNDLALTLDAQKTNNNGRYDGMIIKIDTSYNFYYTSYFGGSGDDYLASIAIDSTNNIILCGFTNSNDFPVSVNAFQNKKLNDIDGFLVKMTPDNNIIWSTYFGGNGRDYADRTTVAKDNNIYMCGYTTSTDLFTANNAYQKNIGGGVDIFLTKFDPNGSVIWSTYFGGNLDEGQDVPYTQLGGLEINQNGFISFTGITQSTNLKCTNDAFQNTLKGPSDALITYFDSDCNLKYCSYLGGRSDDIGFALKSDKDTNLIVVGATTSSDFPIIGNAFQKNNNGKNDGFIVKFGVSVSPPTDTSKPEILTNDSCNVIRTIYINPKKVKTYSISSIDIISQINCSVSTAYNDGCSAIILVKVMNPDIDAYYKLIIMSASGLQDTIEGTIKSNPLSLEPELIKNPLINFYWEKIGGVFCDSIKIYNNGTASTSIDNIYLSQNIYYSIPQSQLPLVINPKDSIELNVCLSPLEYKMLYSDTLHIFINCLDKNIFLQGKGDSIQYSTVSRCNTPVKIISKKIPNNIVVHSVTPNPVSDKLKITFEIDENNLIEASIYNVYGNRLGFIPERNYPAGINEIDIDLNDIADGIYFIELKSTSSRIITSIIKAN